MRRRQLGGFEWRAPLLWVASVAALVTGAGCSPQEVPRVPTYEADIRPLVLSRCVRCHGGGGRLNGDLTAAAGFNGPPRDGYFDRFDDPPCAADAGAGPCNQHGMLFFATDPARRTLLTGYLHPAPGSPRMPPPPSPALTSTQLEIFDAWLAENPPLEK